MRAFFQRKTKLRAGRTARFETLENRLLLTTSRGLDSAAFDALKADWPGFDYSEIVAENVFVVDATDRIDAQTLRRAIEEAKSREGADLIVVQTGTTDATIRFSSGDDILKIDDVSPLTIVATGPQKLTIDANAKSGIFEVSNVSSLSLGGVALTGGASVDGGAVYNSGTLFLDGVYVASNAASRNGGGIYNESRLTVVNSIITDNRATGNGGGVYSTGVYVADAPLKNVNFIACDVVGNAAGVDGNGFGGGIYFAGQDADFNIFAEMRLDASIVVQNRSSSTECDVNIYNSAFYNEIEIGGERYVFEIPVAALIDGDYNLTTFTYWVSSYRPENSNDVGTNQIYRAATPLFVRDYDFTTRQVGDYALYESSLSQAIDKIPFSTVVYPNGRPLVRDFAGNRRVQNGALDAGAFELQTSQVDLATKNGAQPSATATVVGGKLRLEGIETSNLSDVDAECKLQFFASDDLTFDETDVAVGELDALRLAANSAQTFESKDLATELLTPGVAYYFYWRIVSDVDDNTANNIGATQAPVVFYAENNAEIKSASLEFENYQNQRDTAFYLSVSQEVAEQFNDGFTYWWDYGDGRFVKGAAGDWIIPPLCDDSSVSVVALKIVDEATGTVVAKGSSALETIWTPPTIACDVRKLPNDSTLRLAFALQGDGNRAISEWQISWGDGTTSTFNVLASALSVGHYYLTEAETKTYLISLTVVEAGAQKRKTTYRLLDFEVAGTAASASLPETLSDLTVGVEKQTVKQGADAGLFLALPNEETEIFEPGGEKTSEVRSDAIAVSPVRELRVEMEAGVGTTTADAAFREFWKRRRYKETLFDVNADVLEREFELLAFNMLR